jgi:hypothetical protein
VSAHTLVLEIKNARSLYFRLHSRRVEGVPIYPATIEDIEAGLSASGLRLVDRRAIFVAAWLSPLVVFRFERRQRDPLSKARLT